MSLSSKLNAWIKSPKGQARIQEKLEEYTRNGVEKTAAGDSVIPEVQIHKAAAKFIEILRMTAQSYNLPESVMQHIWGMESGHIIQTKDGFEIPLYFSGDLHRDSLENDLGYGGVSNIVALFNNGYHAQNYTYGWWEGHGASTAETSMRSGGDGDYAWVRSKKERDALKFIQQAIQDFNGNYGSEFNVTAIVAADIYEQ